jgi:hypothetical protein
MQLDIDFGCLTRFGHIALGLLSCALRDYISAMKYIAFIAVCVLASVAFGEDRYPRDGVWKPIAAVMGGVRLPDAAVKATSLKISGEKYEVTVEGEDHSDKGTCMHRR